MRLSCFYFHNNIENYVRFEDIQQISQLAWIQTQVSQVQFDSDHSRLAKVGF